MDKQLTMEQINKIAAEQKCKCGKDATRLIKPHSCIFWYFCEDCWNKIPVVESDDEDEE
jgi:hypothetical protein